MSTTPGDAGRPRRAEHVPVLLREVLQYLDLRPGLTVVDGTVGAAGHSAEILKQIGPTGTLIGLDRDPYMLELAAQRLASPNCHLIQGSYADLQKHLDAYHLKRPDRILLDLGLSSDQLADPFRGFGFQSTGPLDLRFDNSRGEPAWQYLERVGEDEFAQVLHEFGEERFSKRIARQLVEDRKRLPVWTAAELMAVVERAMPPGVVAAARKEPATRVFQALRIQVNQELEQLDHFLGQVMDQVLQPGGIVVIISFHSLEDRRVKQAFRDRETWHVLTPKPVTARPAEQRGNPRSRSAKLRAAGKP